MKIIKIILLLSLVCVQSAVAGSDIYSLLSDAKFMNDFLKSWQAERADYGLHISSNEKTKNQKGQIISAITIDIEGPDPIPENVTIEDIVDSNIKNILRSIPINPDYKPSDLISDGVGIGASIVDVNGQKVGYVNYEVKAHELLFARHGLILKDQKLYTFTMAFFDSNLDRKKAIALDVLVIAAIKSGKL